MTRRAALVGLLAAALLPAGLLQLGCAAKSSGLPNAPIFNTGASATIISPGQNAPPMPGYGQRAPAGSASGSYGGPGAPAYPGGPPSSSAPAPGTPGYPGGPPPGAQLYPTGQPPLGNDMAMLGGAVTIDTRNIRRRQDPLWSNPLFWPFAVVAWPFKKLDEAVNADRDRQFRQQAERRITEQTGVAFPASTPYGSRERAQADYERAQQEAIARQLAARGGAPGGGSALAEAAPGGAPAPSLSIADELAALRGGRAPGARAATAPSAAAAPVPGAAAADRVEDRDGDGRPDRWVYTSGDHRRELLDDDHDGRPERTVYYEPGSDRIARVVEDTNGDGEPDSWSVYQDGQLARRRADTNGDGEPDTWTFYEKGTIVRLEADTDGDGLRDRIERYEKGKLASRSEDLDGNGRPERITRFDEKGRPTSLEEDKDSDGKIDVRSYYARGKLVRREILDPSRATP